MGTPLTDAEIAARLEAPVGQAPIRDLCRGRDRPLIIVDDLNRPTPASRVLPAVLGQLEDAGIPARNVRVIMAPGTHGSPPSDAIVKKVGDLAAKHCQLLLHDCRHDVVNVGRTSFGTPVMVNKHVMASDCVIGIGGVYPNQTAGFGGGTKLSLGVLGFRSIAALHYGHRAMGWGRPNDDSTFRRDLDEIAQMIGLHTTVSLITSPGRAVIALSCGAPHMHYTDMLALAQRMYGSPPPDEHVNVVVSNAYPNDLSLTFARMKGMAPLRAAPLGASRVVIAPCVEGVGFHGLYPFMNEPGNDRRRMLALRARVLLDNPRRGLGRLHRRLVREFQSRAPSRRGVRAEDLPVWLYRPPFADAMELPATIPGMRVVSSWEEVVEAVRREQGGADALRAAVYGCAGLQWLTESPESTTAPASVQERGAAQLWSAGEPRSDSLDAAIGGEA